MADRFWVGGGAGFWDADGNWSTTAGGGGGASYPVAGDAAIFTSDDMTSCTIRGAEACDSVTSTSGYTGTLDLTNDSLTVSGDFQFDSGTFDAGTGTLTVSGNYRVYGATFTEGSSTIVVDGTSKLFTPNASEVFYNLTFSGTYQAIRGFSITNAFVVSGGANINMAGYAIQLNGCSSTITGTISDSGGGGNCDVINSATLDTGGTLSIDVQIRHDATIPVRTYAADLKLYSNSTGSPTQVIGAGTITIAGDLLIAQGTSSDFTIDCAANDPAFDIGGTVDFTGAGGGDEVLQAGDGNWNVEGDIDFTGGTFTPAASEVILDGSAAQTVTSDTEPFYDLTSANTAASPGVTFADPLNVTNVFKDWTPSSVLTFTDSVAYVLNTIDLDGQAVGTRIVIRSTGTTVAPTWNVTTNTQCDYVDVSWNNATPGIDIAATNSNDGGNTTAWNFGGIEYDETGKVQTVNIGLTGSDVHAMVETGLAQAVNMVLARTDAQTMVESPGQVVDIVPAGTDAVIIDEAGAANQIIDIVGSETDVPVFVETGKLQTIVIAQSRTDSQTMVEGLAQTLVVAQSRSDVQTMVEALNQIVDIVASGTDAATRDETGAGQVVNVEQSETDVPVFVETGKLQVANVVATGSDQQTAVESILQTVLVAVTGTDAATWIEQQTQAALIAATGTDAQVMAESLAQQINIALSGTDTLDTGEAVQLLRRLILITDGLYTAR